MPSKPIPSPARIDSRGKPGIGGGLGAVASVTVNTLVKVLLVITVDVAVEVRCSVVVTVPPVVVSVVVVTFVDVEGTVSVPRVEITVRVDVGVYRVVETVTVRL